ncbi:MAG: hypothetical protein M1817_005952 [Caeruleum heppii]|nr:MAG: hypothetical protein M1817_005952 [Caeruleum heppii]
MMLNHLRPTATKLLSRPLAATRPFSTTLAAFKDDSESGLNRKSKDHTTNSKDELDVQSAASKAGKRDRASGSEGGSQAATEADQGNNNARAKKDHPEAPDVVIGMNDERGGKGH